MLAKIAIAVLIITVVAFGGIFYSDYLGQTAAAETMNTAIQNEKNASIIVSKGTQKVNSDISDIAENTDDLIEKIKTEEEFLPETIDSNKIIRDVLVLGKACDVSIIPLSTREWTKTQVKKFSYQVLRINLETKGQQANVIKYIAQMQNTGYRTMVIESTTLRRPIDPLDTDIIAEMSLAIYAR
jgi:hypothetical protein